MKNEAHRELTKSHRRAETVVEVLIAVFVLGFMVIQAGEVHVKATRHTQLSERFLIADGIATEGVEAFRGIVASNRLRFSANQDCWDAVPSTLARRVDISNCMEPNNKIGPDNPTYYSLYRDPESLQWSLGEPALNVVSSVNGVYPALPANLGNEITRGGSGQNCASLEKEEYRILSYEDPMLIASDCLRTETNGGANYNSLFYSASPDSVQYNRGRQTQFYRGVTVRPVTIQSGTRFALHVTSTVYFVYLGRVHEVVASTVIHKKAVGNL